MARRRGNKQKPKRKPRNRKPQVTVGGVRASDGAAAYLLRKIVRGVATGREAEALAAVDKLWPADEPRARLQGLLSVWPERLEAELPDPLPAELAEGLALAPLLLSSTQLEAVLAAPGVRPLAAGLEALDAALDLLAAGDPEAARAALRPIGLRSPLRAGRLFVRALCAVQQGATDDARRALSRLGDGPFAKVAGRVLAALDGADPATAARLGLDGVIGPRLAEALRPLEGGDYRQTLARLKTLRSSLPERVRAGLQRDLPGALVACDMPIDEISRKIVRALGKNPDDPERYGIDALITDLVESPVQGPVMWLSLVDSALAGELFASVDPVMAAAAVKARAAMQVADSLEALSDGSELGLFWLRQQAVNEVVEMFEHVLELDPGRRDVWIQLYRVHLKERHNKAAADLAERFAAEFPDDPDAQLLAARDFAARRSFIKAKTYASRAAKLVPHDSRVQDVQAVILQGRGFKQLASGRLDLGLGTLRQAVSLADRSVASRSKVDPAVALVEAELGDPERAEHLRDEAARAGVNPWVWRAAGALACGKLVKLCGRGKLRDELSCDLWDDEAPLPEEPLDRAALAEVLTLADEALHNGALTDELAALADAALAVGELPDSASELSHALGWGASAESWLRVAEHAVERFPKSLEFVAARYHWAVAAERPKRYFRRALEELDALIERFIEGLTEDYGGELSSDHLAEVMEDSFGVVGDPRKVRAEVARYLSTAGRGRGRRRSATVSKQGGPR